MSTRSICLWSAGERGAEAAVETGRADVDLADPRDALVVEIQHELGRARLARRFLPAGLRDRQRGVLQIEQRNRLAAICREGVIGGVECDRAVEPIGRDIQPSRRWAASSSAIRTR